MSKVYDELRKAIKESNKTRYRLWQETGIDQALLVRFMNRKSGLSIESIEKLIEALGLEIIIKPIKAEKK
jgi:DNA-binding transcriptional MerR regulator